VILGAPVPGVLCHGWRFVVFDAIDAARQIKERYRDSRLVAHPVTQQLGIVSWIRREALGPSPQIESLARSPVQAEGGLWSPPVWLTDPDTGQPLRGEPTERALEDIRRRDSHAHGLPRPDAWMRRMMEIERRDESMMMSEMDAAAREDTFDLITQINKKTGQKRPRIFSPGLPEAA
jgi:hypothetical protein